MKIKIPRYVSSVSDKLSAAGFESYIVGGCVRDSLLLCEPNDYDMTSAATPDEAISALEGFRIFETGIKHGTLTVVSEGNNIELTTFRTDGKYTDNRHPEGVVFSRRIEDDLSRRDFTINAMAYSDRSGLIDLYGGKEDLERRLIRCVGEPDVRFSEDGLRIMRALRFAATLGFEIEEKTGESIRKNRRLLENISVERLWSEFSKLLTGVRAEKILREYIDVIGVFIPELSACVGFDQKTKYHCYDVFEHTLAALSNCDRKDVILRYAALFHDIGKPDCFSLDENGGHFPGHAEKSADMTEEIFRRMHTDNDSREKTVRLVREHCRRIVPEDKPVRHFLATHTTTDALRAVALGRADRLACAEDHRDTSDYDLLLDKINEITALDSCLSLKSLAVKGGDLIALGLSGKEIGIMLDKLLGLVIDGSLENDRDTLINEAIKLKDQK